MESGTTQKVQLVRCPECRMLLSEPLNILMYKCGGCGTILQAKNGNNDASSPTSCSQETEAVQRNELNHVCKDGVSSSSSSQNAFLPSSGDCSLDQNGGGDKEATTDHVPNVVGTRSSNSSTKCSIDQYEGGDKSLCTYHIFEVGESSGSSQEEIIPSSGECSFNQNGGGDQETTIDHVSSGRETSSSSRKTVSPSGECFLDQNMEEDHSSEGGESSSSTQQAVLPSLDEFSSDQNEGGDRKISQDHISDMGDCSSSSKNAIFLFSGERYLEQNGGGGKILSRYFSALSFEDLDSSDEDLYTESNRKSQGCNTKQPGVSNEICLSNRDANLEHEGLSQLVKVLSEVELNEMSSLQAVETPAVDFDSESDSNVRYSTTDNMARKKNDSTSHNSAAETFLTDSILSSPDEQPTRQLNVNLSYECSEFFSPRSEFTRKIDKAKSPRFRSSYDYDGSVSSYDGTDGQVPVQHMNLCPDTFMVVNSVISEEHSRRGKFHGSSNINGSSKLQCQVRDISSSLSDPRPCMANRKWGGDELLGSTGQGLRVSNGTRLHDDQFQTPFPLYKRGNRAGRESRSASSPLPDDFHHSLREQEKLKLLRLVYELQYQINKSCHVSDQENKGVFTVLHSKEKYIPALYRGEVPADDIFLNLNYHRYLKRWRQMSNWPHQHKVSCKPFSGEATDSQQHLNCSCMHSHPQESHCSAPLPPSFLPPKKGNCRFHFHPGYDCYSNAYPSSPQHFAESKFPIGPHKAESDYHKRADRQMKEKNHLVKRHLRPTAGGAPFLICYNCLNPLQLPADFLVLKRRFHLLKCGACSMVLKFALERRTHITPYTQENSAQSPALDDNFNDNIHRGNSVSSSHDNIFSPADPVSCSDDYGLSHCKSYSSDGDPIILAPFLNGKTNTDGRNLSCDSSESMKGRPRFIRKLLGNQNKKTCANTAMNHRQGLSHFKSTSRKVSPKVGELPARSSPSLHRLMGYPSPHQLLRRSDPSSSGTSPRMKKPAVTKKKMDAHGEKIIGLFC